MGRMTDSADRDLRWGVTKRLEFIDFRLFWDGSFNRKDLVDFFGISEQQASSDIAQYQARADRNLAYDRSLKSFVRSEGFVPEFIGPFSDRYLLQLVAVQNGWMSASDTWFSETPPIDVVGFIKRRSTSPSNLIRILDAIKQNAALEIEYASLTGSPAGKRTIAPHSFLFATGCWYVRAWSKEHNEFRDYSLNRIASAALFGPSSVTADLDLEWHHTMELILIPNPKLEKLKQAAVAAEYDMVDEELRVPSRLSAAFYIINEHNLDVEPGVLKPEKQQLVLKNLDEVVQTREVVRRLSIDALRKNKGAGTGL
ncbi:transcriptional regulator [Shinella sp. SUS2]|nr:transcriptional regulator [Shinella sp. SUS2]KOC71486.1 transcriptional regulator [Shinella sp. GWS1]